MGAGHGNTQRAVVGSDMMASLEEKQKTLEPESMKVRRKMITQEECSCLMV